MYPFYLGIDLHLKRTYVVLMDTEGEVIDERRLLNAEMVGYLEQHVPQETYAVLEATCNWPFMYDMLSEHVERVELAHPKEVKAIANAAVKTDQIDAGVLAHLARLNYLPTAYAAPKEVRDLRLYTRHRSWLIRHRTQAKNRLQAVLASYNLASPVSDLFGVKGREFLEEVLEELRPAFPRHPALPILAAVLFSGITFGLGHWYEKDERIALYRRFSFGGRSQRLGIVNRVVPADKLEEETQAMAVKLSLVPPEVMRLTKQPINRTYEIMGLFEALKTNIDYSNVLHTAEIPELVEFERIIEEQGLKAALRWRETRYS